jgi:hypothetical protein
LTIKHKTIFILKKEHKYYWFLLVSQDSIVDEIKFPF